MTTWLKHIRNFLSGGGETATDPSDNSKKRQLDSIAVKSSNTVDSRQSIPMQPLVSSNIPSDHDHNRDSVEAVTLSNVRSDIVINPKPNNSPINEIAGNLANSSQARVKAAIKMSQMSIDFDACSDELKDLLTFVYRDGTLLDLQRAQYTDLLNAAIERLEHRRNSLEDFRDAAVKFLHEPEKFDEDWVKNLDAWFFYLAYRGCVFDEELIQVATILSKRFHENLSKNTMERRTEIAKFEWFGAHGINLDLTINNLKGFIIAIKVIPLPEKVANEMRVQAENALTLALSRNEHLLSDRFTECLEYCTQTVSEGWHRNQEDSSIHLQQTESFCIPVCLRDILEAVKSQDTLIDNQDELTAQVDRLRHQFDQIRFRSSSVLFYSFKEKIEQIESTAKQSIEFEEMFKHLDELAKEIKSCKFGKKGINWLHESQLKEALELIDSIKVILKQRHSSHIQLESRLEEIKNKVTGMEKSERPPSRSVLKEISQGLSNTSALVRWIFSFPIPASKEQFLIKKDQLRDLISQQWKRMEESEPMREAEFIAHCADLIEEIQRGSALPDVLSEIKNTKDNAEEEFSSSVNKRLSGEIRNLFDAFRTKMKDVQPVNNILQEANQAIQIAHRRIYSAIDFDALNTKVNYAHRWIKLREFPEHFRGETLRQVKNLRIEISKLRIRQQNALAKREQMAAEIFSELDTDVRSGVELALRNPGAPNSWEELVSLDRRWRQLGRTPVSEEQKMKLREDLDKGFQGVREARIAFAVESGRRFAGYSEVLSDILSS